MMTLPEFATYMVPIGAKEGDMIDGSFGLCIVYKDERGMLRLKPFEPDARADFEAISRATVGGKP